MSTVEKATIEQLEELKRTDGMLAVSLRTELDAKRAEFKSLRDLYENSQTQLLNTLVDRDEQRRQKEELAQQVAGAPEGPGEFMTQEKFEKIKQRHNTLKSVSSAVFGCAFVLLTKYPSASRRPRPRIVISSGRSKRCAQGPKWAL